MNLLVVCGRYPWPARRGDQLRTLQWIDALTPQHRVVVLAPEPGEGALRPALDQLEIELYEPPSSARRLASATTALLGSGAAQIGLFESPDLARRLRRRAGSYDGAVLLLARMLGHLGDLDPPPLVDLIDCLSLNLHRRAAFDRPWLRPLLRLEARRLQTVERRLAQICRRLLVVADRDRRHLCGHLPESLHERLATVPLALPPTSIERRETESELAFTGNLGYFVNRDAIGWWGRQVWPLLLASRPGLRWTVAGDRPSGSLTRQLRRLGARLVISPPDLRRHVAGATLALAPLRAGSGVPVKILEAWSVGTPVVASPWAAAGLDDLAGGELAIADAPGEWCSAIERLLDDPAERQTMAERGHRALRRHLPELVAAQMQQQVEIAFA